MSDRDASFGGDDATVDLTVESDPTTTSDDVAADPTVDGAALNGTDVNGTNGTNGTEPAKKKGPSKKQLTLIAVKFINAMWATMFASVLSEGLQQWTRSTRYYNATSSSGGSTSTLEAISKSTAYKSYKWGGYLLMTWGVYGWCSFLAKRFLKDSAPVKQNALAAAYGNGVVGVLLMFFNLWKTFGRNNCSTDSGYFQCWYDSSPTDVQKWTNRLYTIQSENSYTLAGEMIWLSLATTKILNDELQFVEKKKEVKKQKEEVKEEEASEADASTSDATDDSAPATDADAAPKDGDDKDGKKKDGDDEDVDIDV
jgi:hypothetical protein